MRKRQDEGYYRYWGKGGTVDGNSPCHLLVYHSLDVAAVGQTLLKLNERLAQKFCDIMGLSREQAVSLLVFFLSLHDIGKFSEGFQNLLPKLFYKLNGRRSDKPYSTRHDTLGFLLWREHLSMIATGEDWFSTYNTSEKERRGLERAFCYLASAVTGHHGMPPSTTDSHSMSLALSRHFGSDGLDAAEAFTRKMAEIARLTPLDMKRRLQTKELIEGFRKASWIVAGLAVLCDWIASGNFACLDRSIPLEEYWKTYALPGAKEGIKKAGFKPKSISMLSAPERLFSYIETPTQLQRMAADFSFSSGPKLFILEDVTGSGKTEAALILAKRLMDMERGGGFFMALPTMATSNAMFERLKSVYRKFYVEGSMPSLVLAHSARHLSGTFRSMMLEHWTEPKAIVSADESAFVQCSAWLADNRKKALLADIGAGTIDQCLLAVLPSRHQSMRLLGLADRILIVDEVHAYDPYMNRLLENLLYFHASFGGSAILLSATLPLKVRSRLAENFARGLGLNRVRLKERDTYPLMTCVSADDCREVPIEPTKLTTVKVKLIHDIEGIYNVIKKASDAGKCICWIRNTVDDALAAYNRLEQFLAPAQSMLFHARFALGDRLKIEEMVCKTFGKESTAEKRKGKVLVATQVVEQSLDLDFDILISDLAPMDLIIQRAGRLCRHPRDRDGNPLHGKGGIDQRGTPRLYILSPIPVEDADADWFKSFFPGAAHVYPFHGRLWLTAKLLSERGGWTIPDDARMLIERVFSDEGMSNVPDSLLFRDDEADVRRRCDISLAALNSLKLEDGYLITPNQWLDDTLTPTRLGELQTTLRLAIWNGGELKPWYDDGGDFSWDLSQLSVRESLIRREMEPSDPALEKAIQELKEHLPDRGRWSLLIPLTHREGGVWEGVALDRYGRAVKLQYCRTTGLKVIKNGGAYGV